MMAIKQYDAIKQQSVIDIECYQVDEDECDEYNTANTANSTIAIPTGKITF